MAFTLLDRLAEKENKEAPRVYKSIIMGLVENYRDKKSDRQIDQVTTEMILRSFTSIFKDHESIPKHAMLDPFLDQLINNIESHPQGSNLMTTAEMEFLTRVHRDFGGSLQE